METFKTVNNVPTKLLMFGKNVQDDLSKVQYLVLVFPGNPGVIDYYREFMNAVYDGLQIKYPRLDVPVWGISHAGHQVDNIDSSLFPTNPDLYTLEGQYEHKMSFIKDNVPKHVQIIGVGHSIGCKTWLETIKRINLDSSSYARIYKCFMLFPTLERMRDTPNGKSFNPLIPYRNLIMSFLWPITLLPTRVHKFILSIYFIGRDKVPPSIIEASLQMFNFQVLKRSATMAKFEMEQVYDLDVNALKSNLDKLFFYFGTTDGWCPLSYVEDMKTTLPGMNFKICDKGFEHAFVIKSSSEIAAITCNELAIPYEN